MVLLGCDGVARSGENSEEERQGNGLESPCDFEDMCDINP